MIEVNTKHIISTGYAKREINTAVDVISGITGFVEENGWKLGFRNDMSVDFCIACGILDLDPIVTFDELLYPINTVNGHDRIDFTLRAEKIDPYWGTWYNNPLSFMTNEHYWKHWIDDDKEIIKLITE